MDHHTASEMMRLDKLEKAAQHYQEVGRQKGKIALMFRAIRLETAVNEKMNSIMSHEISPFRN
jgi:hypothetical protein